MAQLSTVADRRVKSRAELIRVPVFNDNQRFAVGVKFPEIDAPSQPFLPHFGVPNSISLAGESMMKLSTLQFDNALTQEQRLRAQQIKYWGSLWHDGLRNARARRRYDFERWKETVKPKLWYYHAYGFHTKRNIVPVDVKIITAVHRKRVVAYKRVWVLYVARNKGFKPKGPQAYWKPLDRIGKRWLHYKKVKYKVTKKWFSYKTERHFRASFDTFQVPIMDKLGRTGVWRFNRPLYNSLVKLWKLMHPVSIYEASEHKLSYYKDMYDRARRKVTPVTFREARQFIDCGVAEFSTLEAGRLDLFSRSSSFEVQDDAIRFYSIAGSEYSSSLVASPGTEVYFSAKPAGWSNQGSVETQIAYDKVGFSCPCVPSNTSRIIDCQEDISREIDSGFVRMDSLDYRSNTEADMNLTRAVIELKDVPSTFAIGKSCIETMRQILKAGEGGRLPGWAKALFPEPSHRDLAKLPPKTLSLWAKAWRKYPVLREIRVGVLSVQAVAGIYLCYKWGVVPTLEDIGYVTNSVKDVLFAVRSGLSRLGNLSALKANTAVIVSKRLTSLSRREGGAGEMSDVPSGSIRSPFEFQEILMPTDFAVWRTHTFPNNTDWVEAYSQYAHRPSFELWTPSGGQWIPTGCQCPDPHFWSKDLVNADLSATEKWLTEKAETLLDLPWLLRSHYKGSKLFALYNSQVLRDAMQVQAGIVDRLTAQMKAYEVAFEITPFSWAIGWMFDVHNTVRDIQNHWHNWYAPFQADSSIWGSIRAEAGIGFPMTDVLVTLKAQANMREARDFSFRERYSVYRFGKWVDAYYTGTAKVPAYDLTVIVQPILTSGNYASHYTGALCYRRAPVLYEFEDWATRFQVKLNGDKIMALSAALLGFVKL